MVPRFGAGGSAPARAHELTLEQAVEVVRSRLVDEVRRHVQVEKSPGKAVVAAMLAAKEHLERLHVVPHRGDRCIMHEWLEVPPYGLEVELLGRAEVAMADRHVVGDPGLAREREGDRMLGRGLRPFGVHDDREPAGPAHFVGESRQRGLRGDDVHGDLG